MVDERVEIELLAKDFASKVFERLGTTAEKQGKRTEKSIRGIDKAATSLTGSLKRTAAAFVGVGAAALAIRKGARDFIAFNKAISEVSTILDEDQISLQEVESNVRDLSLALGENETLIARGFYQTLSAGVTEASDAFLVLEESAKLAVAGVAKTEDTVDAITTVLNAYGFQAQEAGRISDQLFKTVELGKVRVEELAASLGQVVPIASELGLTFEEVLAATAAMTKQGAPTAEAITRIRAVMIALLKNSEKVDVVLRSVGGSFDVNTIRAKGLLPVLLQLRRAFAGNEDELTKFLGRAEATTAILALTRAEGQDFIGVLDGIKNSAGATGAAVDKQLSQPAARLAIVMAGVRQGFADLAGEGLIRPLLEAAGAFGETSSAAETLRDTIGSLAPVLRVFLGLASGAAEAVGLVAVGMLALADAVGAIDIPDDEIERLSDSLRILDEVTVSLITGQGDFTNAVAIQAKRRREALEQEASFVSKFADELARELGRALSDDASREGFRLFEGDEALAEAQGVFDEFTRRAREAGISLEEEFGRAFSGTGLGVGDLIAQLRRVGIELGQIGGAAVQFDAIREQVGILGREFERLPRPLAEQNAQLEEVRAQLLQTVTAARAAGDAIDTAFIRELAVPLRVDPDELLASLDLVQEDALRKLEEFGRAATDTLEGSGIDLGAVLVGETLSGVANQRLTALRDEFGDRFQDLARLAADAGAEIPEELLGPLIDALLRPEFGVRAAFREELAGLASDASGAGDAIAEALRQIELADVAAAFKAAKVESQIVAAEVAAGLRPQLDLVAAGAELAALEFRRMGLEGEASASQSARGIAAVNDQLADQVAAAGEAGLAFEILAGTVLDFTGAAARIAATVGPALLGIVESESRIATIVQETLGPFESQRQAIEDQAASWHRLAEERLAALNPDQLDRERQAIDRTTAALLGRVGAEEDVARARAEAQIVSLEAEAGIRSITEASLAGLAAEAAHFEALVRSGELTEEQADRAVAAVRRLVVEEAALALIQNENAVIAFEVGVGIRSAADAQVASINLWVLEMKAADEAGQLAEGTFERVVAAAERAREAATTFLGRFQANLAQLREELSGPALADVGFGQMTSAIDSASRALVDSEATFEQWRDAVLQDLAAVAIRLLLTKAALLALSAVGIESDVSLETGSVALGASALLLDRSGDKVLEGAVAITVAAAALLAAAQAAAAIQIGTSAVTFAEGGIMEGQMIGMSPLPVKRYAFGGIADSPQVGIFGEGSGAEAFVPLGGDRKIPVRIETNQGSGGGSGDEMTQNIDARFEVNIQSLDAEGSGAAVRRIMPEVLEQFSAAVQGGRVRGSRAAIDSIRFATRDRG